MGGYSALPESETASGRQQAILSPIVRPGLALGPSRSWVEVRSLGEAREEGGDEPVHALTKAWNSPCQTPFFAPEFLASGIRSGPGGSAVLVSRPLLQVCLAAVPLLRLAQGPVPVSYTHLTLPTTPYV